jgi:Tfp pilus assembly protein PilF
MLPATAPAAAAQPAAASAAPATLTAVPGGAESHRNEAEALTTKALNAFVENNYPKAKKAVDKALALDPSNKRARELQKILGALG